MFERSQQELSATLILNAFSPKKRLLQLKKMAENGLAM
jgi:hypothetical protein